MRKFTGISIFLFIISSGLHAQTTCCPYINSVTVIPVNPPGGDSVYVELDVTTPTMGTVVSINHSVNGFVIDVDGCYSGGMIPTLQNHVNIINLGILPNGNYQLHFNARYSSSDQTCTPIDSTNYSITFTVGSTPPPPPPPCCIEIDTVHTAPASPINDTTPLNVIALVSLPSNGFLMQDNLSIIGNDIEIEACYFSDSVASTTQVTDTFALGMLTPGNYNLTFTAFQSDNDIVCNIVDTAVYQLTFTVDSTSSPSSVDQHKINDFSVYPNPATSQFTIKGLNGKPQTIFVHDVVGNMIYTEIHKAREITIDVVKWPKGVYFIKIAGVTQRIVVQ
jgi:hypothetical protein